MSARVVRIAHCWQCPENVGLDYCNKLKKEVHTTGGVPEECPLETVENFLESNFNIDKE